VINRLISPVHVYIYTYIHIKCIHVNIPGDNFLFPENDPADAAHAGRHTVCVCMCVYASLYVCMYVLG
jgi:hypothetical protein